MSNGMMVHYNFRVSLEDSENILQIMNDRIGVCHECIMKAISENDEEIKEIYNQEIKYIQQLIESMNRKVVIMGKVK